jgi:hypothetical protein
MKGYCDVGETSGSIITENILNRKSHFYSDTHCDEYVMDTPMYTNEPKEQHNKEK